MNAHLETVRQQLNSLVSQVDHRQVPAINTIQEHLQTVSSRVRHFLSPFLLHLFQSCKEPTTP